LILNYFIEIVECDSLFLEFDIFSIRDRNAFKWEGFIENL